MAGIADILGSAGGGTPWGAIAQGAAGIAQSIIGGITAHRATKQLENLKSPTYTPSQSIQNYYNTALQRFNTNPYQSQQYQYAINAGKANQAAGINALQSRRSAVGGIAQLTALANNNALKAGVGAEQEQNQRFNQLGQAANAQANQQQLAYQYNQLMPYQQKYNLLAAKAAGNNQVLNAGLSNAYGGLSGIQNYQMAQQLYGYNGNNNSLYNTGGGGNNTFSPDITQAFKSGLLNYGNRKS